MKSQKLLFISSLLMFLITGKVYAQSIDQIEQQNANSKIANTMVTCFSSATSAGNLTVTSFSQTVTANTGILPYWTFSATAGNTYNFSSCGAGYDTQIEILQNGTQLSNNDDNGPLCSGTAASISWTCASSGVYQVCLAKYNCALITTSFPMQYYYTVPPQIYNIMANQGVYGDMVTINGTGFTGATNVSFNGTSAFFIFVNDQTIQAFVPTGASTGYVFVTVPGNPSPVVVLSPSTFTIIPTGMLIYSFSPLQGPSGTIVTVRGKYFTGATGTEVNNMSANYSVINDSTLTLTVPAGASTGKIKVINGSAQALSSADFTVANCVPPIVSVSGAGPYTINATGGTPPYSYSINGAAYSSNNVVFSALNNNTILVKDAAGCIGSLIFAVNTTTCNTLITSGGQGTTYNIHQLGSTAGVVTINYDFYPIPDQMDVYYNGSIVATTGGLVSGAGTIAFNYPASGPTSCTIKLYAPISGTAWKYNASCPTPCNIVVNQLSLGGGSYRFNVTGGVPPYTFSMDGGFPTSSNIFNSLSNGVHNLVITSLGCNKTHDFSIGSTVNCSGSAGSGGQGTNFTDVVILGSGAGTVNISYNMYSIPDQMDVYYNGNLVATTGGLVSGSSVLSFYYPGGSSSCTVRMYAPNSGTAWDYNVACPIVGIKEITNGGKFNFFPNPGQTILNVTSSDNNKSVSSVEIIDLIGNQIYSSKFTDKLVIDIAEYKQGLYFVKVINESGESVMKFMKE